MAKTIFEAGEIKTFPRTNREYVYGNAPAAFRAAHQAGVMTVGRLITGQRSASTIPLEIPKPDEIIIPTETRDIDELQDIAEYIGSTVELPELVEV